MIMREREVFIFPCAYEGWQNSFFVIPRHEHFLEVEYQLCKRIVRGESKIVHASQGVYETPFPHATYATLAKTSRVHDAV